MKTNQFCIVVLSSVLSVCLGCSAVQLSAPIEIRGLIIRNDSGADLRDIELLVETTRTVVTCSYIPLGGKFSTEFPLRTYQHNYVIVSFWRGGKTYKTRPLYALIPDDLDRAQPVDAVVVIDDHGRVRVQLSP